MKPLKINSKNNNKNKKTIIIISTLLIILFVLIYFTKDNSSFSKEEEKLEDKVFEEKENISEETNKSKEDLWEDDLKIYGDIYGGNIFYRNKNTEEKQITFMNLDEEAVWSPDRKQIAFLRNNKDHNPSVECKFEGLGYGGNSLHEIWLYDIEKEEKTLIVPSYSNCYARIKELVFTPDSKKIYFMHSHWVTTDAIELVDIDTKEVNFVTAGDSLEVVQEGEYEGYIIVSKHKYKSPDIGSYWADFIISPEGEEIKRLD